MPFYLSASRPSPRSAQEAGFREGLGPSEPHRLPAAGSLAGPFVRHSRALQVLRSCSLNTDRQQ